MVWNKTPEDKVLLIQKDLEDLDFNYKDIAEKYSVSYWLVGQICKKLPELQKARYSHSCSKSKLKKNHMRGRTGLAHQSSKKGALVTNGYYTVFPPDWWKGKVHKGRIYQHILIACEANGLSSLPKGHCVHHIDGDKTNNHPTNPKTYDYF